MKRQPITPELYNIIKQEVEDYINKNTMTIVKFIYPSNWTSNKILGISKLDYHYKSKQTKAKINRLKRKMLV